MSQIQIENLTFCYEGSYDNIFENVSFRIDTDWKLGFIGRNGRGKTTFLNLLLGRYEYRGKISSPVPFAYFPYEVADPARDTREALAAAGAWFPRWQLQRELAKLDVAADVLDRPFGTLSNGERTKVMLAALFLNEDRFLLIDEPTNHLDMEARRVLSRYLNAKKGFILVSHDRMFLDGCIDHVLSVNRADIEVQSGNFSSWLLNRQRQDHFELSENEKLKKEMRRLEKTAREKADWAGRIEASKIGTHPADRGYIGHKSAKMMKRAKAIEQRQQAALREKSKLLKNIETADSLKLQQLAHPKNALVRLSDVSVRYGDRTVCSGVTFSVEQGDRVALTGKNGSGKSSILKLICGEEVAHAGQVYRSSGLALSYVPQDTSFLRGSLSAYAAQCGVDESLFKAILRKLDFARVQFEKDMQNFSGGQKKKVLIARSLCQRAHLHIWDEPLNFIDVISRMQIEELILQFEPTILFVEHDRAFCERIATKQVALVPPPGGRQDAGG